jgi:hypothetical protein
MPAKRDTGGHILTEWPFCYVKSAIEHKRRYALPDRLVHIKGGYVKRALLFALLQGLFFM